MIRLSPTSMAHLGEAVARLEGKAHFVAGAMPGEVVLGEVVVDKGSWARVRLETVEQASPARVTPPCEHFTDCGGCQWQFAEHEAQLEWKADIVAGQLSHLGGLSSPEVRPARSAGDPYAYRNRMDFRVADGRPALHRSRSSELVPLGRCLLLSPGLADLFDRATDLTGVRRLTMRASQATGERLVILEGEVPPSAADWGASVAQRTRAGLRVVTGTSSINEEVRGNTFRITGGSFFQNNTAGAGLLVDLVREAAGVVPGDTVLDGYAGGGLFGISVAGDGIRIVAVEASPTSTRDLRRNLRTAAVVDHRVVRGKVEEAIADLDEYWQVAIVDPPRPGLGVGAVEAVIAAMPRVIVYVSCDPAGLARDARYLADRGYRLDWAAPVDLFPQTFHIETVARFERADAA